MSEWDDLRKKMESNGWKCIQDDEERINFSFYEDEDHEWFRDYNKKTKRFMQMNGRQKVNLLSKHE